MTDHEWAAFTKRLFTQYPSVIDRLRRVSPDPDESLRMWRKQLERFSFHDCMELLEEWMTAGKSPWNAYAIEEAPRVIAGTLIERANVARRRREVEETRRQARRQKRLGSFAMADLMPDSPCKNALVTLIPIHKRLLAGEITADEYNDRKREVFRREGI